MKLQERIALMVRLGEYMVSEDPGWMAAKHQAYLENNWFVAEFVDLSVGNIARSYLSKEVLEKLAGSYSVPDETTTPKKVGLVLAGNIPLVGFHDALCTFVSGHYAIIKPSSKDEALIKHLLAKLAEWNPSTVSYFVLQDMLKNCDAYIATGSNNSSRYFEYYFQKYPHIIRRNRTSVAILTGDETAGELDKLSDDICQYFGLGCRNVTKLYVPKEYDFINLLRALDKYSHLANHNKFKNNYDYNLAVHLLNNNYYMTNGAVLLIQNESPFAPISQLHYQFYDSPEAATAKLLNNTDIQCIVGRGHTPFGEAQCPDVDTFADGVDTMKFLTSL